MCARVKEKKTHGLLCLVMDILQTQEKKLTENVKRQIFGHPWYLLFVQNSLCVCESVRLTINNGFLRLIFHCLSKGGGNETDHNRFGLVSNQVPEIYVQFHNIFLHVSDWCHFVFNYISKCKFCSGKNAYIFLKITG